MTNEAIRDLIETEVSAPVYAVSPPENTAVPFVVFKSDLSLDFDLEGNRFATQGIEIDVVAVSLPEVDALLAQIDTALRPYAFLRTQDYLPIERGYHGIQAWELYE